MKNKTIYVSMATMDDTETTVSIENLFNRIIELRTYITRVLVC
jgi:hypothetical protein